MYLLMRDLMKIHTVNIRIARTTDFGYGGGPLPEGTTTDLESRSRAVKTIQLILDDDIRNLALSTQEAMTEVATMGVRAEAEGRPPISASSGGSAWMRAGNLGMEATAVIAYRIRVLMQERTD
jgi:hypothetical protein